MLDINIYIEYSNVTVLMKNNQEREALELIESNLIEGMSFEKNVILLLLKGYCHYKLQEYPLAINAFNKILKQRFDASMEHHILSQSYFYRAKTFMAHGSSKNKNRLAFMDVSKCFNLLCFQDDTLSLMDELIERIEKI